MIILKKIDLVGQALIFGSGIICLIDSSHFFTSVLLFYYFPIGCWQMLSALIHFGFGTKIFTIRERKLYLLFVAAFSTFLPVATNFTILATHMYLGWCIVIFIGSCLAVWYFTINFRELTILEKRRLIQFR